MRSLKVFAVLLVLGCGVDKLSPEDDVPLSKVTISWPILGGIDTKRSPIALAPGSNLVAQDVRQERLGEWRRRDGFAQNDQDTLSAVSGPYQMGPLGPAGAVAFVDGAAWYYGPSLTSGARWAGFSSGQRPFSRTRTPVKTSISPTTPFARLGTVVIVSDVDEASLQNTIRFVDTASAALLVATPVTGTVIRAAATDTYLVAVEVTAAGAMNAYVYRPSTGGYTTYASIKTGMSGTAYLDAMWYGGATVTIVCRTSTNAVRHIEFNPSTGALATDVATAGISCASTLSLLPDPAQSGVRFIASSHTTPTTRVTRVNSAGAVLTDDQVQAVASTHITGIGYNVGADWDVVYQTTGNLLRRNVKTGGVVGAAVDFIDAAWGTGQSIDSQAWYEPTGVASWRVIVGIHSQNTADPQDTWVELSMFLGNVVGGEAVSVISSLAAGPRNVSPGTLLQVTRTAANRFSYALPVQIVYENNAGTIVRHYSIDMFEQVYRSVADLGAASLGQPVQYEQTTFVPGGRVSFVDPVIGRMAPTQLGIVAPPLAPTITPSVGAGALTPGKQYQYAVVIEQIGPGGAIWRSPPSDPEASKVTMSATQNTNTIVFASPPVERQPALSLRFALYRTDGDGSLFRRIYSTPWFPGTTINYTDNLADSAISDGEPLYTQGEVPNIITPPASHLALSDGRLWLVNREYPTEVSYSKKLRPGRLPEFTDEHLIPSLVDEFGPVTGIFGMDDKTIVLKESAIYVVSGEGLDDAGAGNNYVVTRVSADMGAIPGSPTLSLGTEGYFVSRQGISRISGQGVEFIGSPVDAFLNQPQIQTPETVRSIVYSARWNEVRFVTNASVLIYSRTFGIWYRFVGGLASGSPLAHSFMVNGAQWIVREDGKIFVEGSTSQLLDGATDFEGFLRSQWVIPAGPEGQLRLYLARVLATRTAGGSPVYPRFSIFRDYDDDTSLDFGAAELIDPDKSVVRLEGAPHVLDQTCNAFSMQVAFPSSDNTWRIERWAAVVGVRPGYQRIDTERMVR